MGTEAPIKPFGLICAVLENGNVNTTAITNGNTKLTKQVELDNKVLTSVNLTQDQLNIGKLHNLLLAAYEGKIPLQNAYKIETNDEDVKTAINSKEIAELCSKIGSKDESTYSLVTSHYQTKLWNSSMKFLKKQQPTTTVLYV